MLPEAARCLHGPGPRRRRKRSRADRLGARGARSVSRLRGRRATPFAHQESSRARRPDEGFAKKAIIPGSAARTIGNARTASGPRSGLQSDAFHPQQHGRPGRRSAWVGMPRQDHQYSKPTAARSLLFFRPASVSDCLGDEGVVRRQGLDAAWMAAARWGRSGRSLAPTTAFAQDVISRTRLVGFSFFARTAEQDPSSHRLDY